MATNNKKVKNVALGVTAVTAAVASAYTITNLMFKERDYSDVLVESAKKYVENNNLTIDSKLVVGVPELRESGSLVKDLGGNFDDDSCAVGNDDGSLTAHEACPVPLADENEEVAELAYNLSSTFQKGTISGVDYKRLAVSVVFNKPVSVQGGIDWTVSSDGRTATKYYYAQESESLVFSTLDGEETVSINIEATGDFNPKNVNTSPNIKVNGATLPIISNTINTKLDGKTKRGIKFFDGVALDYDAAVLEFTSGKDSAGKTSPTTAILYKYNEDGTLGVGIQKGNKSEVAGEGRYRLVVSSEAGEVIRDFSIDNTAPEVRVYVVDENGNKGAELTNSSVEAVRVTNKDVMVEFSDKYSNVTAELTGRVLEVSMGEVFSNEQEYEITATDAAGHTATAKFRINKAVPTIEGVESGAHYKEAKSISFDKENVKVTLDTIDGEEVDAENNNFGEGTHTIVVSDRNNADNNVTITFVVDLHAPTFNGFAEGEDTIKTPDDFVVRANDDYLASTVVKKGDTVLENVTTLDEEGTYTLVATDKAGNETVKTVVVDKNAPKVTLAGVEYQSEDNEPITIDVPFEGEEGVTFDVSDTIDENPTYTLVNSKGQTIEGKTVTANGTYTLTAEDEVGHKTIVNFIIARGVPTVTLNGTTIEDDTARYYKENVEIEIGGEMEITGAVLEKKVGETYEKVVDLTDTYEVATDDETHNEYRIAVSYVGSDEAFVVNFVIDKKMPTVDVASGTYGTDKEISFDDESGIKSASIIENGVERALTASELASKKVSLEEDGTYTLKLEDMAENGKSFDYTIDTTPASVVFSVPGKDAEGNDIMVTVPKTEEEMKSTMYFNKNVTLAFEDALSVIKVTVDGTEVQSISADLGGSKTYTTTLTEGPHKVVVEDLAGNKRELDIVVDTVLPGGSLSTTNIYDEKDPKKVIGVRVTLATDEEYTRESADTWTPVEGETNKYYLDVMVESKEVSVTLRDLALNELVLTKTVTVDLTPATARVEYDNVDKTNGDVIIRLYTNKHVTFEDANGLKWTGGNLITTGVNAGWYKYNVTVTQNVENDNLVLTTDNGYTSTTSYKVSNIDKTVDVKSVEYSNVQVVVDEEGNKTEVVTKTNQNVTVTITAGEQLQFPGNESIEESELKLANGDYIYTIEVEDNAEVTLDVRDAIGNTSTVTYKVRGIDRKGPDIGGLDESKLVDAATKSYLYNTTVVPTFTEGSLEDGTIKLEKRVTGSAEYDVDTEYRGSGTVLGEDGKDIEYRLTVSDGLNPTVVNIRVDMKTPTATYTATKYVLTEDNKPVLDGTPIATGMKVNTDVLVKVQFSEPVKLTSADGYEFVDDGDDSEYKSTYYVRVQTNDTNVSLDVEDEAGNPTTSTTYTVDFIDKVVPTISGLTDGETYNKAEMESLEISFSDNSTYEVFITGGSYNKTPYDPATTPITADGEYTIEVIDAATNRTAVTFTVDMTPPTITFDREGVLDDDGETLLFAGQVTPTFRDGTGVLSKKTVDSETGESKYEVVDNNFVSGTVIDNEGEEAEVEYLLVTSDAAGNGDSKKFVVDSLKPSADITNNLNGKKYINVDAIVTITLDDDVTMLTGATTNFVPVEGTNGRQWKLTMATNGSFAIQFKDKAGNVTDETITVNFIDKVDPTVRGVTEGAVYNANNLPVITYSDNISAKGYLTGGGYNNKYLGSPISITKDMGDGEYTLVVKDLADNTLTYNFRVDTTPPVITLPNTDKETSEGLPLYRVTTNEEGEKVGIVPNFEEGATPVLTKKGSTTAIEYARGDMIVEDGEYTLTVSDAAGNEDTVTFVLDGTVPTLVSSKPELPQGVEFTNETSTVLFTFDETVEKNMTNENIVPVDGTDGKQWRLTVYNAEPVTLKFTDLAGNEFEETYTPSFMDKTVPVITLNEEVKQDENDVYIYAGDVTVTINEANLDYLLVDGEIKRDFVVDSDNASISTRLFTDGKHTVKAFDKAGNESLEYTFEIYDKAPSFDANGTYTFVTIKGMADFSIPEIKATDARGGELTAATTNTFDVNEPGTYTLTYTAKDNADRTSEQTVTVIVLDIDEFTDIKNQMKTWADNADPAVDVLDRVEINKDDYTPKSWKARQDLIDELDRTLTAPIASTVDQDYVAGMVDEIKANALKEKTPIVTTKYDALVEEFEALPAEDYDEDAYAEVEAWIEANETNGLGDIVLQSQFNKLRTKVLSEKLEDLKKATVAFDKDAALAKIAEMEGRYTAGDYTGYDTYAADLATLKTNVNDGTVNKNSTFNKEVERIAGEIGTKVQIATGLAIYDEFVTIENEFAKMAESDYTDTYGTLKNAIEAARNYVTNSYKEVPTEDGLVSEFTPLANAVKTAREALKARPTIDTPVVLKVGERTNGYVKAGETFTLTFTSPMTLDESATTVEINGKEATVTSSTVEGVTTYKAEVEVETGDTNGKVIYSIVPVDEDGVDGKEIANELVNATFTVDTHAPEVTITETDKMNDGVYIYGIGSTVTIGVSDVYEIDRVEVNGVADANFGATQSYTQGTRTIKVYDKAGNASAEYKFEIYHVAPEFDVPEDETYVTLLDEEIMLDKQAATDALGKKATITPSGSIDYEVKGPHTITYTATDAAGQTTKKTVTVHVLDVSEFTPIYEDMKAKFDAATGNILDRVVANADDYTSATWDAKWALVYDLNDKLTDSIIDTSVTQDYVEAQVAAIEAITLAPKLPFDDTAYKAAVADFESLPSVDYDATKYNEIASLIASYKENGYGDAIELQSDFNRDITKALEAKIKDLKDNYGVALNKANALAKIDEMREAYADILEDYEGTRDYMDALDTLETNVSDGTITLNSAFNAEVERIEGLIGDKVDVKTTDYYSKEFAGIKNEIKDWTSETHTNYANLVSAIEDAESVAATGTVSEFKAALAAVKAEKTKAHAYPRVINPVLSASGKGNAGYAIAGDTLTLTFESNVALNLTTSEDEPLYSTALIGGKPAAVTPVVDEETGKVSYRAQVTVDDEVANEFATYKLTLVGPYQLMYEGEVVTVNTITVDRTPAQVSLEPSNGGMTNQPITLEAIADDEIIISGITYKENANAEAVTLTDVTFGRVGTTTTYRSSQVSKNGIYTISYTDLAGNAGSESVTINNIDIANPTISSIVASPATATKEDVVLTITPSEALETLVVDGTELTVNEDGTYTYTVDSSRVVELSFTDLAGNPGTDTFDATYIDKAIPTGTITVSPSDKFVKASEGVTLILEPSEELDIETLEGWTANHVMDGDKVVTYRYEKKVYENTNGEVTVTFEDLVGNEGSATYSVSNIDTDGAPRITETSGNLVSGNLYSSNVTVSINDDNIKEIVIDGKDAAVTTTTHTFEGDGTHTIKVVDKAGNETEKTYIIDTTAPVISYTGKKLFIVTNADDFNIDELEISVSDSIDKNASLSKTDETVKGVRTITYSAIDEAGNEVADEDKVVIEVRIINDTALANLEGIMNGLDKASVDKTFLTAEARNKLDYTEESWNKKMGILTDLRKAIEEESEIVTQAYVDAQVKEASGYYLEAREVDMTNYNKMVETIEAMNRADYTATDKEWNDLQTLANKTFPAGTIQSTINKALTTLREKYDKVNETIIKAMVLNPELVSGTKTSGYLKAEETVTLTFTSTDELDLEATEIKINGITLTASDITVDENNYSASITIGEEDENGKLVYSIKPINVDGEAGRTVTIISSDATFTVDTKAPILTPSDTTIPGVYTGTVTVSIDETYEVDAMFDGETQIEFDAETMSATFEKGSHKITVRDKAGNVSEELEFAIYESAPKFVEETDFFLTVKGQEVELPTYKAIDALGNELTATTTDKVNYNSAKDYTLTYTVEDAAGQGASMTVTVRVLNIDSLNNVDAKMAGLEEVAEGKDFYTVTERNMFDYTEESWSKKTGMISELKAAIAGELEGISIEDVTQAYVNEKMKAITDYWLEARPVDRSRYDAMVETVKAMNRADYSVTDEEWNALQTLAKKTFGANEIQSTFNRALEALTKKYDEINAKAIKDIISNAAITVELADEQVKTSGYVKAGETLTLTFTSLEDLDISKTLVTIAGKTATFDGESADGTYVARVEVSKDDEVGLTDGKVTYSIVPVTVSGNPAKSVSSKIEDAVFTIDTVAPIITPSETTTPGIYAGPVTVTVDEANEVDKMYEIVEETRTEVSGYDAETKSATFTSGSHKIVVVDKAGNESNVVEFAIYDETKKPVITFGELEPNPDEGLVAALVTVKNKKLDIPVDTFTATDSVGNTLSVTPSSIVFTYTDKDGVVQTKNYSSIEDMEYAQDGVYTITFSAEDAIGVVGERVFEYRILNLDRYHRMANEMAALEEKASSCGFYSCKDSNKNDYTSSSWSWRESMLAAMGYLDEPNLNYRLTQSDVDGYMDQIDQMAPLVPETLDMYDYTEVMKVINNLVASDYVPGSSQFDDGSWAELQYIVNESKTGIRLQSDVNYYSSLLNRLVDELNKMPITDTTASYKTKYNAMDYAGYGDYVAALDTLSSEIGKTVVLNSVYSTRLSDIESALLATKNPLVTTELEQFESELPGLQADYTTNSYKDLSDAIAAARAYVTANPNGLRSELEAKMVEVRNAKANLVLVLKTTKVEWSTENAVTYPNGKVYAGLGSTITLTFQANGALDTSSTEVTIAGQIAETIGSSTDENGVTTYTASVTLGANATNGTSGKAEYTIELVGTDTTKTQSGTENGSTDIIVDVTAPADVTVSYVTGSGGNEHTLKENEKTNQNVTIKIKSDEELISVVDKSTGKAWKIVSAESEDISDLDADESIWVYYYRLSSVSKNVSGTLVVKDLAGNESEVAYNVNHIDTENLGGTITPSTEDLTNQSITLTLTVNETMKSVSEGWTLQDDGTYTMVVSESKTYSATLVDMAGNSKTVSYEVTNIDTVKPVVSVSMATADGKSYTGGVTNQDVTVTITSDKDLKSISDGVAANDWLATRTVSEDGKTFTYELTFSSDAGKSSTASETFTMSDMAGNAPVGTLGYEINIDKEDPSIVVNGTKAAGYDDIYTATEENPVSVSISDDNLVGVSYTETIDGVTSEAKTVTVADGVATIENLNPSVDVTYTVTATDGAGNSETLEFHIDGKAPVITGATNNATYEDDVEITVTDGNLLEVTGVDEATVDGNSYLFDKDGTYTVTATDKAGHTSSVTFTISKTPLVIGGLEDGKTVYDEPVEITFNKGTVTVGGEEITDGTTIGGNNTIGDGTYRVVVTAPTGVVVKDVTITVDTVAPTIKAEKIVTSGNVSIQDGGFTNGSVLVTVDDVNVAFIAEGENNLYTGGANTGTQTVTISGEGAHTITAQDIAGRPVSITFTIDTEDPTIVLTGTESTTTPGLYGTEVEVSVTDNYEGATFVVTDANGDEVSGTKFGNGTYTVTATDKAGNVVTKNFTVNTEKPVVTGVENDKVYGAAPTITIGENVTSATLNGQPFTSASTMLEGKNTLVISTEAGVSETITFIVDTQAPYISEAIVNGGVYKSVIANFADATTKATGMLDGKKVEDGDEITDEGKHTLVVTDEAGYEASVTFYVYNTAPVLTVVDDKGVAHASDFEVTLEGSKTQEFKPYEYSVKEREGITTNVSVSSTVDLSTLTTGENYYTVTYTASDVLQNTKTITVKVYVRDSEKPVISGTDSVLSVPYGAKSIDALSGVSATDAFAGNVDVIADTTKIDVYKVGTYTMTYTADDGNGNPETVTRTVKVMETTISDYFRSINGCKNPNSVCYSTGTDDNFVWYSGHLWRVVRVNKDNTLRLITAEAETGFSFDDNSSVYAGSNAEQWLNNVFYPSLNNADKIVATTEYTKFCNQGNTTTNIRYVCNASYEVGSKVGLITIDEYNILGGANGFLNNGERFFTMTPTSANTSWVVYEDGSKVAGHYVNEPYAIRPVININPIDVVKGSGKEGSPIFIAEGNEGAAGQALTTRTSGEYVMFGGKKWRVVSSSSEGTKLIADSYVTTNSGEKVTQAYGTVGTFSTTSGIGQYLNTTVYDSFNDSEKSVIRLTTWNSNRYSLGQNPMDYMNNGSNTDAYVGLIRVGELMSGAAGNKADKFSYWTMTSANANTWYVNYDGTSEYSSASDARGVRPVITLEPSVKIAGGNGTEDNAYTLEY